MYKIDKGGGGFQKSFFRTDPTNTVLNIYLKQTFFCSVVSIAVKNFLTFLWNII